MTSIRVRPSQVSLVLGLVLPAVVALALSPLRSSFDPTDAALVLVVVIVAIATTGNRLAGVLSALSSSTWFDFFYAKPFEHFSITRRSDIETAILLVVVGIVVTELAARGHRQRQIAREGASYLALIHDFSEMVSTGESAQFVVIRAAAELTDLLFLRDCRFEEVISGGHLPRLTAGGQVIISGRRWSASDLGLPGAEVELLIEGHGHQRGRFLLVPTPGHAVSLERRVVAVAIAGQVGAALAAEQNDGPSGATE